MFPCNVFFILNVLSLHTLESGEFLLAFARRNVPIDRVLEASIASGLQYEVLDVGLAGQEPIYRFTFCPPRTMREATSL